MKIKKPKAMIKKANFNNIYYKNLNMKEYIEKEINSDGNCFYHALSYYYKQTKKDYNEFHQLITSYIESNLDEYFIFNADEDLNDPNIDKYSEETILKNIIFT